MTAKKICMIILGVLVLIGGCYCVATPGITYLAMVWVIGFMMFLHAIEDIVTYGDRKKEGLADGWDLASAILSCICGCAIIVSGVAELITGVAILYFLFVWMIVRGIIVIIVAFRLKKIEGLGGLGVRFFIAETGNFFIFARSNIKVNELFKICVFRARIFSLQDLVVEKRV